MHVDIAGIDGTSTPHPVDGATVTWTFDGPGTLSSDTCATGTTAGTCDIVFNNDGTPGSGTLTATSVTFTVNGQTLTIELIEGEPGLASNQVLPVTAGKAWVFTNLAVQKSLGGATPVAGGDPFNYTLTVTNEGPIATSAPITVVDTLGPGLAFAGTASIPASAGSCAPPSGSTLTCTITTSLAVNDFVTIVVPARVLAGTVGPLRNLVTIDSPEDPLCPGGVCPPPPVCPSSAATATQPVAVAASTTGADPSDNQACVLSNMTVAPTPVDEPSSGPLARTGLDELPAQLGVLLLLSGIGVLLLARRRRRSRSPV